jgi:uncharacterized protein YpmB
MKKYTITEAFVDEDTLYTVVTYELDGKEVTVKVPHFQPQSKEEVISGVENRLMTEDRKKISQEVCEEIIKEISLGVAVDVAISVDGEVIK